MPPPKVKSKSQQCKQAFIGQFTSKKNTLHKIDAQLIDLERSIEEKKVQLENKGIENSEIDIQLSETSKKLHVKRVKLGRKKRALSSIEDQISNVENLSEQSL